MREKKTVEKVLKKKPEDECRTQTAKIKNRVISLDTLVINWALCKACRLVNLYLMLFTEHIAQGPNFLNHVNAAFGIQVLW